MGKVRVYELAKELKMSNKELVEKLQEMGLSVRSHSSSIDDNRLKEVKDRLLGLKTEALADAKGRPTVIRRRKKVAEVAEDETTGEAAAEEIQAEEAGMEAVAEVREAAETPSPDAEAPADELQADSEREAAADAEQTDQSKIDVAIKRFQRPKVEPAKIIARPTVPAEPEKLAPASTTEADREQFAAPGDVVESADAKTQPQDATAEASVKQPETRVESPETAGVEAVVESQETVEESVPAVELPKEAPLKVVPKLKRIKKAKDEPARIISRPTVQTPPPSVKPAAPATPSTPPQAQTRPQPQSQTPFRKPQGPPAQPAWQRPSTPAAPAEPAGATDFKKGKRKKKGREGGEEDFDAARRRGLRRKEVIEHDELYDKDSWERPGRFRKPVKVAKKPGKTEITVPKAIKRRVKMMDEAMSVADLAKKMGIKASDVIRKLISLGVMASINQAVDFDTATLVASEFGYEVEKGAFDEQEFLQIEDVPEGDKMSRPPVVTVMGHVDHGKTSLLDRIRQTNVIDGEAGGITQHIGAYHVTVGNGTITFLDTPGHAAFTAMRARGAQVTDIVVLVVAADDGVMQQTREAVNHARAAEVPILVAVNKVDKPEAEPDRIRREMSELGLVPEAWGGDTIFVDLSAKTGQGVDDLMEMILLQAEILELKGVSQGRARGRIVEARLDKGRGPVATLLVQEGVLNQGDPFVCGVFHGKVRAMFNDKGQRLDHAGPSVPVEIQGISGVPQAGDEFVVLEDEKQAKQISTHRLLKQRESDLLKTSKVTLETLFDSIKEGVKELNLVLKADVQGSLEAIADALGKLGTDEIKINLIHSSTGAITETDIMLASASNALVVGFNVRPTAKVQDLAEQEQIQIRFYDIIYKLIDEIKEAMAGLLEPIFQEEILGRAEVRDTFQVSKVGTVAGSSVLDGKIVRGAKARLLRDNVVIYDGRISSLKRFKDDAKEVLTGYECGISLDNYNDIKVGDVIEAYTVHEVAATLG